VLQTASGQQTELQAPKNKPAGTPALSRGLIEKRPGVKKGLQPTQMKSPWGRQVFASICVDNGASHGKAQPAAAFPETLQILPIVDGRAALPSNNNKLDRIPHPA
jgi:hypothetical protein